MMLSVLAFQEHIIAVKEFKMLKLETLFRLVNSVGLRVIRKWLQMFKNWPKLYLKIFLREWLNFRTKIEKF